MQEIRLNGESMNIVDNNVEKLKEIFPEVFNEDKIDFEKLQNVLGNYIDTEDEKYRFTWNGKMDSLRLSQTPSMGTLRPCKEESKDWDTTQNLYIEGDNLEVLKLLQNSYLNKIKMIYIDPPYNTGNDFVYKDDFKDNIENYKKQTGQVDSEGNAISTNKDSDGRYHTNWLNMMYPRLRLARNLLSDDGVIFISIDDNEVTNLKRICDEVFGEDNFISQIAWKNKYGAGAKTIGFIELHEYIICYSKKTISNITSVIDEETKKAYNKKDEKYELRGGYITQPLMTNSLGDRPNLMYPIEYNGTIIYPNKQWIWSKERLEAAIAKNEVEFNLQKDGTYSVRSKSYLYDENGNVRRGKPLSFINGPFNQEGTKEIRELFDNKAVFDFTKPKELIMNLLSLEINDIDEKDFIVMDFFSGSATTAHAVMKLNLEDNGNRKFICVQLPEITDEKSEAYKAGYKNICEIGKERIRRAGEKIKEEIKNENQQLKLDEEPKKVPDIGFKVFKLDSSNIRKWNPDTKDLERSLLDQIDNFVDGRSEEDALYEIILKCGLDLTVPVEEITVQGKKVYSVGFGALIICLDNDITLVAATEIAKLDTQFEDKQNVTVVFKDNGFKDDSVKTNIKETIRGYGIGKFVTV